MSEMAIYGSTECKAMTGEVTKHGHIKKTPSALGLAMKTAVHLITLQPYSIAHVSTVLGSCKYFAEEEACQIMIMLPSLCNITPSIFVLLCSGFAV